MPFVGWCHVGSCSAGSSAHVAESPAAAQLWWLASEIQAEKQAPSFMMQLHKDIILHLLTFCHMMLTAKEYWSK